MIHWNQYDQFFFTIIAIYIIHIDKKKKKMFVCVLRIDWRWIGRSISRRVLQIWFLGRWIKVRLNVLVAQVLDVLLFYFERKNLRIFPIFQIRRQLWFTYSQSKFNHCARYNKFSPLFNKVFSESLHPELEFFAICFFKSQLRRKWEVCFLSLSTYFYLRPYPSKLMCFNTPVRR